MKTYDEIVLRRKFEILNQRLNVVGALYEGDYDKAATINAGFAKLSKENNANGYDFGEQIYDLYAEIGYYQEKIERYDEE